MTKRSSVGGQRAQQNAHQASRGFFVCFGFRCIKQSNLICTDRIHAARKSSTSWHWTTATDAPCTIGSRIARAHDVLQASGKSSPRPLKQQWHLRPSLPVLEVSKEVCNLIKPQFYKYHTSYEYVPTYRSRDDMYRTTAAQHH